MIWKLKCSVEKIEIMSFLPTTQAEVKNWRVKS